MKKGMSLHLNEITLPKGVTAVTRGKPNPVLVSMVVIGGTEEAVEEGAAAEGAPIAAAAVPAPEAAKAPAAKEEKEKGGKSAGKGKK
jgi:large subunit ribosomal protein L25